jgi:hypothetical protein
MTITRASVSSLPASLWVDLGSCRIWAGDIGATTYVVVAKDPDQASGAYQLHNSCKS